jgi:predicted lysophospholipase L1 biosynthesis ABC-type transport system permease subunit
MVRRISRGARAKAFDELVNAIKGNPQLQVKVEREAELAEDSEQQVNGELNFVSYFVGAILAVAATTGAANSLYALVGSRRRQIATLRAIGFTGAPIIGYWLGARHRCDHRAIARRSSCARACHGRALGQMTCPEP